MEAEFVEVEAYAALLIAHVNVNGMKAQMGVTTDAQASIINRVGDADRS